MAKVSFFTAISFKDQPKNCNQSILEKVDSYFYLGGKKAHIINTNQQTKAILVSENQSLALTCLKVISYFTFFLPMILLVVKAILRSAYTYEVDDKIDLSVIDSLELNLEEETTEIDLSVIDSLELNLEEEATVDVSIFEPAYAQLIPDHPFTLRQAAKEVITEINNAIQENSLANPDDTMQEKNSITLNTQAPWMKKGSNLYFYDQYCGVPSEPCLLRPEQYSNLWLYRILQALVNKNHIQSFERNDRGYSLKV